MKQIVQQALARNEPFGCPDRIARQIWQRVSCALVAVLCATRLAFGADPGSPPQLTQVSPTSGVVGDRVDINGENLATTLKVEFNGVSAQFSLGTTLPGSDIWMIHVYVPAGATTGPIKVTTNYGTAMTADPFVVLPGNPPTIDSFSPASGPPGTRIVINGQNLKYTTNVLLNGVAIQWSPGIDPLNVYLNAQIPPNGTTGPMTVSSPFGSATSSTNFTVTAAPPLTVYAWPTWLEAGFGDWIMVSDASQVTDVQLNGAPIPFSVADIETVYVDIPLNAQSGVMTLFTPVGTVSSPDPIPVYPHPVISSLKPASGPVNTTVTVLGQNLDIVTQVKIGPNGIVAGVDHIDSGTISFMVRDDATSGEVIAITKKGNGVNTGLQFSVTSGVITTRAGTIDGHTPSSDPIPIPPVTNAPPRQASVVASRHEGSTGLPLLSGPAVVQAPVLSIVSAGSTALKLSWPGSGPACVLESTDGLLGRPWTPLSPIPNENELVIPQAGKQQFFRLRVASE